MANDIVPLHSIQRLNVLFCHQHQGVQHMQPILSGGQQYYAVRAQPTFVPGPSLQQSSAPPQPLPVQSQPAHQTHHVQHQQSQANPNVGILQVNPVQQQPEQRENVQPPPQRKKNRLQIVDPATGNKNSPNSPYSYSEHLNNSWTNLRIKRLRLCREKCFR